MERIIITGGSEWLGLALSKQFLMKSKGGGDRGYLCL